MNICFQNVNNGKKKPGALDQQTLIGTPSISQPSAANNEDDNVRGTVMMFLTASEKNLAFNPKISNKKVLF